eukprot:11630788-Alexandrium_andersonii.AAC.1
MVHRVVPIGGAGALPAVLAGNLVLGTATTVGASPVRELHLRPKLICLTISLGLPLPGPGLVRTIVSVE